jgi:hypothetical protein
MAPSALAGWPTVEVTRRSPNYAQMANAKAVDSISEPSIVRFWILSGLFSLMILGH